jgi:hypothetical protein
MGFIEPLFWFLPWFSFVTYDVILSGAKNLD